ncbi:MAG: GspE/PulE family protein [Methylacidiphilales bacterium]|nr:GspE/PulE family protein [Candidatus Methylacidiphilales bacterium]MDW8350004.1 GspE/PulE family protein [Verrucomicrobiae bacterium]
MHDKILELCEIAGATDAEKNRNTMLDAAQQQQSIVRALLELENLDEKKFLSGLSTLTGIPWYEQNVDSVAAPLREKFPARVVLRHHLCPVEIGEGQIGILTYDPFDYIARQQVNQLLDTPVVWFMSTRRNILNGLRQGYGVGAENFDDILENSDEDVFLEVKQETNVLDADDSDEAAVVRFVNQIFREALHQGATDVHIEPIENDLRIRYRVDGMLTEVPVPPQIKRLQSSLISRLKIMAHLDIAERRLPQDGRINLELDGKPIDVRVATIPSVVGESVSLRLLGQERFDFLRLQMEPQVEKMCRDLLALPNGIILITGPTGSGKSTTLYTFLTTLNTTERRIVTIEDPVEHKLPGVVQIAVKPEIDLTFAKGLRSILRGDPNVVMIGEMRDLETAEIAIRAALTGHLVFSTLHTNDAVGGITRLIDMGIEPFLVASAVRAFIAQRLVRRLCLHCKTPAGDYYSQPYLESIGFPLEHADKIYRAVGCDECRHTGYQGRLAIYEVCLLTQRLQDMITQRKPANLLRPAALEEGMITLREYGFRKVIAGETTIEEVLRVTIADRSEEGI